MNAFTFPTIRNAEEQQYTVCSFIFDSILKKIDDRPKRQASTGLKKIVEDFNLDVSRLPPQVLQQIQVDYAKSRENFDKQIAQAIHNIIKQH